MRPNFTAAAPVLERPRDTDPGQGSAADRLRNRFSGNQTSFPLDVLRRRRDSNSTAAGSQVSVSSITSTTGSASQVGPSRVAKTGWSRRPKVTFPPTHSTSNLHQQMVLDRDQGGQQQSQAQAASNNAMGPRPSRISLRSAMKPTQQQQPAPALPSDPGHGPSLDTRTKKAEITAPKLSFRPTPAEQKPLVPAVMPGAWDDAVSEAPTSHHQAPRPQPRRLSIRPHDAPRARRPSRTDTRDVYDGRSSHGQAAHDHHQDSDSEYSDSTLSDHTEATTAASEMDDGRKPSANVKLLRRPQSQQFAAASKAHQAALTHHRHQSAPHHPRTTKALPPPETRTNSGRTVVSSKSGGGRRSTLHIEVLAPPAPPKESAAEVRRREEEFRQREEKQKRIEANLRDQIAQLQAQLEAEADARQQDVAKALVSSRGTMERLSVMQADQDRYAQSMAALERERDQALDANKGALERFSVMQAEMKAEKERHSQAMAERHAQAMTALARERDAALDSNKGALERLSVMQAEHRRHAQSLAALAHERDHERGVADTLRLQIESAARDSSSTQELVAEQGKALADKIRLLAEAEKTRDELMTQKVTLLARCEALEREFGDAAAVRSQNEIVMTEQLAVATLAREVLQLKVDGFEAEVSRKNTEIDNLTRERDGLKEEAVRTAVTIEALTDEKRTLVEENEKAEEKIAGLEEESAKLRATLEALEADKSGLEGKVSELEAAKTDLEKKIKSLEDETDELVKTVDERDTQIADITAARDGLKGEIASLTAAKEDKDKEIEEAKKALDSAKSEGEKEVSDLKDKITAAEADVAKAQDELKELQAKPAPEDKTAAVEALTKEKEDLTAKVATLETNRTTEKTALETEKTELLKKVSEEVSKGAEARASQQRAEEEAARAQLLLNQLRIRLAEAAAATGGGGKSKRKKSGAPSSAGSGFGSLLIGKSKEEKGLVFVRTSSERGRMQVMKKAELRTSRSSSRNND